MLNRCCLLIAAFISSTSLICAQDAHACSIDSPPQGVDEHLKDADSVFLGEV